MRIVCPYLLFVVLAGCTASGLSDEQRVSLSTLLMKACWDSNAGLAELLIKDGADPNTMDENGVTALMLAASNPRSDNAHLINILVLRGADVHARDKEGRTPFQRAFEKGYLHSAWALLHKGANPNFVNDKGQTPLMAFAEKWNPNAGHLEPFLAKGVPVNARDKEGRTVLMIAAESPLDHKCGVDTVAHLVTRGADINFQDQQGRSALMGAAQRGRLEIVKLLLEKNPQIDLKDKQGKTALALALENGHLDVATVLINAGADVNARDTNGKSPLILLDEQTTRMRERLLEKGAGN